LNNENENNQKGILTFKKGIITFKKEFNSKRALSEEINTKIENLKRKTKI
jgi:hypothetical protein